VELETAWAWHRSRRTRPTILPSRSRSR